MARRWDHVDAVMLALVTIWGSAFAGIRALRGTFDPYEITWYRYALFPFLYGAWILWRRRDRLVALTPNEWLQMLVLGNLAVLVYHIPLNYAMAGAGEGGISAATGALIVATVPLWTTLLAVVSRKEPFRAVAALGSLVALAGVAIVVVLGTPHAEVGLVGLAALAMLAPLSWAIYGVWARPLIHKHGGLFTTGLTMSLGTLSLLPIGIAYGVEPLAALAGMQWMWLIFLALLSTVAGYAMYNYALKRRSSSDVASYIYLNPVMATIIGWIALGEAVTWWFLPGAALVIAGLVVINRSRVVPKA